MGGDRAAPAKEPAWSVAGGRPAGDLGHSACAEGRLLLVRCPAEYGPSTTVYNRFDRWSHRGFWLTLLDALVEAGAVMRSTAIDSTYIKAQRATFGAKEAFHQAIGRSCDSWTTKVHALTDVIGRRYALMLTPGNVSDVKAAPALLERAGHALPAG